MARTTGGSVVREALSSTGLPERSLNDMSGATAYNTLSGGSIYDNQFDFNENTMNDAYNSSSSFGDGNVSSGELGALGVGLGAIGNIASSFNQYDVQGGDRRYSAPNIGASGNRRQEALVAKADKYQAEYEAMLDEERAFINGQFDREAESRQSMLDKQQESNDIVNRYDAAMRLVQKGVDKSKNIDELGKKLFNVSSKNDVLKKQLTERWGQ
jgi:hypothetical protein